MLYKNKIQPILYFLFMAMLFYIPVALLFAPIKWWSCVFRRNQSKLTDSPFKWVDWFSSTGVRVVQFLIFRFVKCSSGLCCSHVIDNVDSGLMRWMKCSSTNRIIESSNNRMVCAVWKHIDLSVHCCTMWSFPDDRRHTHVHNDLTIFGQNAYVRNQV